MKNLFAKKLSAYFLLLASVVVLAGCAKESSQEEGGAGDGDDDVAVEKVDYESVYDPFFDKGQYYFPRQKFGKTFISIKRSPNSGLDQLIDNTLSESLVGLAALAVNEGRGDMMFWMYNDPVSYMRIKAKLPMVSIGEMTEWDILASEHGRNIAKGYVLYDTDKQESLNVAGVAAHVYEGVMIEKRDKQKIEALGYTMLYDATNKTIQDSWNEFQGKCKNNALVLMPTLTYNHRSTAIAFRLMLMNLNKIQNQPDQGQNAELFKTALDWLEPLSPVFGWEGNVGEEVFVNPVTHSGNVMFASDWMTNAPLLLANYENRQAGVMPVTNPNKIKYGDAKHYMTFYMSDGDNLQWLLNNFDIPEYYDSRYAAETKMSFGYALAGLSQASPDQNEYLINKQNPANTLMECFGGGYFYVDNFAINKDRPTILNKLADKIGHIMRQHRCNVLTMMADDVTSSRAKESYQAFINHNDNLIGIVMLQFSPYAGGRGEIMWFKNKKGINIPVVTARYSIWNHEGHNNARQGSPAYVASLYNNIAKNSTKSTFSCTSVHAWSDFKKIDNDDVTGELTGGNVHGVEPAYWCQKRLDKNIKVVNAEEMIWQLRMYTYPEETKKLLKGYN